MTMIVAVSVSEQIEKFGAYAGFAAVIGLAVLSLLYFAQAREAKRLREWAASLPVETQAPVGQTQRVVPQPVARPAAAPTGTPGAPITPAAQAAKPEAGALPGAPAATAAAAAAAAATASGTDQPTEVRPAATGPAVPGPTPETGVAVPPAVPSTGAQRTVVSPPPARPLRSNQPSAIPPRPPGPARAGAGDDRPSRRSSAGVGGGGGRRSRLRTLLPIGVVAAVLLAVALVVSGVLGGGSENEPKKNQIAPAPVETSTTGTSSNGTIDRSSTAVAVLNGTTISGLARGIANNIENGGFRLGDVTNAADQTRAATSIEYVAGSEPAAQEIAKLIRSTPDAVVAMSEGTRVLAPTAQVVVTVGSDQSPTG